MSVAGSFWVQRLLRAPAPLRHGVAVALFAAALWGRFALIGVLPPQGFPFLTFFPAVLLATYLAGFGPGLLTAALSVLAAWYFFIPPQGAFPALATPDLIALTFFAAILLVDCVVIHLMNVAQERTRLAEHRVRADEHRLRLVLDNLFVHVALLDPQGTVREVNQAPLLLGRISRERMIGHPLWDTPLMAGDAAGQAALRAAVLRAAGGETVRYDACVRDADGGRLTLDLQIAPVRDPDGGIGALVASGVDVTARVQALAERERSRAAAVAAADRAEAERRVLDATLNAVPAAIILADANGRLLRMNPATEQIWGIAPHSEGVDRYGEWQGWWADGSARQGERIAAHEWGLARALRGERVTDLVEIEPFGRPGERRLTLLSAAPVLDAAGGIVGAVVAQVDVTARAQAERALRESEDRFRVLVENIPQLAWMGDARGTMNWANQRWFRYTGATAGLMAEVARTVLHPDDGPRVAQKFREHVAAGEPWEDTFRMRRHDGEYRWFLSRAVPVRDAAGAVGRWLGTHTDVTDQMLIERALRDSEDRLLAREAALQAADRQKDEFLATLAHELRNPLAPIRAATQVMRTPGVSPEAVRKMNEVIDRQSAQLTRLVDDLLDVSRITFGTVNLKRRTVDLRTVVEHALESCQPQLQRHAHEIRVHLPEQPLPVDVDDARIGQCVANVIANACKFTPDGGRIVVEVRPMGGERVAVTVTDTGQGISSEMLGKVFELFAQERRSGMGGNTGLGIGLALTRKLVEMHGGSIRASSPGPGRGSTFEIVLPLLPAQPQPAPETPAEAGAPLRRAELLAVDDNPDAVESLATLLELGGHRVFKAADGRSALAAVRAHRPRVVLLDIGLPDLSGYEVARRIREMSDLPAQPVLVALTGWGQEDDRERAWQAGFDHHLTKPADPQQLEALLRRHLQDEAPPAARAPH